MLFCYEISIPLKTNIQFLNLFSPLLFVYNTQKTTWVFLCQILYSQIDNRLSQKTFFPIKIWIQFNSHIKEGDTWWITLNLTFDIDLYVNFYFFICGWSRIIDQSISLKMYFTEFLKPCLDLYVCFCYLIIYE